MDESRVFEGTSDARCPVTTDLELDDSDKHDELNDTGEGDDLDDELDKGDSEEHPTKPGFLKLSVATFLILGPVSTFAQFIAASVLGIADHFMWGDVSKGGLVTFVASIILGMACKSWKSWRVWIWTPIGVLFLLSFIVMAGTAETIAQEDAVVQAQEEADRAEIDRQANLYKGCLELRQKIDEQAAVVERELSALDSTNRPSWVKEPPSWVYPGAVNTYNSLVDDYNATCVS